MNCRIDADADADDEPARWRCGEVDDFEPPFPGGWGDLDLGGLNLDLGKGGSLDLDFGEGKGGAEAEMEKKPWCGWYSYSVSRLDKCFARLDRGFLRNFHDSDVLSSTRLMGSSTSPAPTIVCTGAAPIAKPFSGSHTPLSR